MIKKIFLFLLSWIFLLNSNFLLIFAENNNDINQDIKELVDFGIINSNILDKKTLTSEDIIIPILKIVGVNDELADFYGENVTFEQSDYYDYSDFYTNLELQESGYYVCVLDCLGIIYGKNKKFKKEVFFSKEVTAQECVGFMMRFLSEKADEFDYDEDLFKEAQKNGLIKKDDNFYEDGQKKINAIEFCKLLNRMLYHKVGRYFSGIQDTRKRINNDENFKYINLLKERSQITFYTIEDKDFKNYLKSNDISDLKNNSCFKSLYRINYINDELMYYKNYKKVVGIWNVCEQGNFVNNGFKLANWLPISRGFINYITSLGYLEQRLKKNKAITVKDKVFYILTSKQGQIVGMSFDEDNERYFIELSASPYKENWSKKNRYYKNSRYSFENMPWLFYNYDVYTYSEYCKKYGV